MNPFSSLTDRCFSACLIALLRIGRGPSGRLTARGGMAAMFGACFLGLLIADWTGWEEFGYAVFFMASSLTAYYVRQGSLLPIAICPPLLFFAAMALEKLLTASGVLDALVGTLLALGRAAPWLFAGTALTAGIALLRATCGARGGAGKTSFP